MAAIAGSPPAVPRASDHVSMREWGVVMSAMIGAFMAILNIQITNASLAEIQGSLAATLDEGSWISTSYLVAEIIVIPLTGWLAQVFSVRRYLLVNTTLFLMFSALCATATDLPTMIVFRAFHGFTGGVLIPMSFFITMTTLPPSKQPVGISMFTLTATFAPALGPSIGGWVTDRFGWQYIFYLNLLPGVIMLAGLWLTLPKTPMKLGLLKNGDWAGMASMAAGLAALEVFLEEGNRKDWFGSDLITWMAIVAAVSLSAFVIIELTIRQPFINLRLLKRRTFCLASISNMMVGLALYGSVYILPVYLSQIQGYDALQIGDVMIWIGLPQLVVIPLMPFFMRYVDRRLLVAIGLSLFAASCFLNGSLSHLTGGPQFLVPNLVRSVGQAMMFPPLTSLVTIGIEREQAGSASGLFNMMRNLGGSIGIAVLSTFISKREQFHSNHITEQISSFSLATQNRLDRLTEMMAARTADLDLARHKAMALIDMAARREAFTMAFSDSYRLIGCALLIGAFSVVFIEKPPLTGGGGGGGH